MPTKIEELQASSPAYQAMPTGEFARRMYDKYYADKMSYGEFAQKTGAPNDFAGVTAEVKPSFSGVSADVDTSAEKVQKTADTGIARLIKGEPQQRGNEFIRTIGDLGAREVLQGAYGTYGALGGDAINQFVLDPLSEATGGAINLGTNGRSYRQLASDAADQMGMRRPDTPTARVMADIGEGLSGTALTMGAGAVAAKAPGLLGQVGQFFSANPILQGVSAASGSAASGIARENGASQGNQLLAGIVGGLSPSAARVAGGATMRGLVRGTSPETMQGRIADFAAAGATPTAGQAAGTRRAQAMESFLSGVPGSSGTLVKAGEKQAADIGRRMDQIAANVSPTGKPLSQTQAGRSLERGVNTFLGNVNATRKALYWQVDRLIPGDKPLPMSNTQVALAELTTPTQGAMATTSALVNPRIAQIAKNVADDLAANGGAIPYSAAKELRSRIGEELADFALSPDRPTQQYKRLYAGLSRDLDEAAKSQGSAAAAAAKRANNYYKASAARLDELERVVGKNGGPEAVFNAAFSGTRDGASTLRTVMKSLPPESKGALASAFVRRMGRATPGQQNAEGNAFSLATYLTNWSNLSQEARSALFAPQGKNFVENMDRIARSAQHYREGSRVFANPPGTAAKTTLLVGGAGSASTIGALLAAGQVGLAAKMATGVALTSGSSYGLAKLMSDPDFVAALARSTSLPRGAIPAQASLFRKMGESKDDPAYGLFADWLEEQTENSPSDQANANQD